MNAAILFACGTIVQFFILLWMYCAGEEAKRERDAWQRLAQARGDYVKEQISIAYSERAARLRAEGETIRAFRLMDAREEEDKHILDQLCAEMDRMRMDARREAFDFLAPVDIEADISIDVSQGPTVRILSLRSVEYQARFAEIGRETPKALLIDTCVHLGAAFGLRAALQLAAVLAEDKDMELTDENRAFLCGQYERNYLPHTLRGESRRAELVCRAKRKERIAEILEKELRT